MSAKKFAIPRTRTKRNAVEPGEATPFITPLDLNSTGGAGGRFHVRINRPFLSGADDQEKKSAEQHAEISSRFMRHAPEAVVLQLRQTKVPESMAEQDRNFCGNNRDGDVDQERDRGEAREQAENEQRATDSFHAANERPHDLRRRNADLGKSTCAQIGWIKKFLNAFSEKYRADEEPNQNGSGRSLSSGEAAHNYTFGVNWASS